MLDLEPSFHPKRGVIVSLENNNIQHVLPFFLIIIIIKKDMILELFKICVLWRYFSSFYWILAQIMMHSLLIRNVS